MAEYRKSCIIKITNGSYFQNHDTLIQTLLLIGQIDATWQAKNTYSLTSTANKFYSSAGHHEQKNKKKSPVKIKFLVVAIK